MVSLQGVSVKELKPNHNLNKRTNKAHYKKVIGRVAAHKLIIILTIPVYSKLSPSILDNPGLSQTISPVYPELSPLSIMNYPH